MSDLQGLIERVEAATGPCLELDADIARAMRITVTYSVEINPKPCGDDFNYLPPLTASVDAALALAERVLLGCWWLVGKGQLRGTEALYGAQLLFGSDEVLGAGESPATPALAILSAILHAKLAQAQEQRSPPPRDQDEPREGEQGPSRGYGDARLDSQAADQSQQGGAG
ncbi:hypothetical protein [Phenylobacterium sp.]|jgi:hypothetical protein|uniref:hypothetical protein n=1 Tax=Phenylobacterium sp. TaxID=1871053 RepID=UPI002F3FA3A0